MDENQVTSLLRAIAISSASSPQMLHIITPQSRSEAFATLENFKSVDNHIRIPVILNLIQTECHTLPLDDGSRMVNVTAITKLYALGILQSFLRTGYSKLNDVDRLSLRNSVVTAARQLLTQNTVVTNNTDPNNSNASTSNTHDAESRILAMKVGALIADVAVRDFPQRWTTFIQDLFVPPQAGGIWYNPNDSQQPHNNANDMIGVKICLECLKLVTEDCTDSDFNSKISTSRRNDILIGLNEVKSQFLPLFFDLLSTQYSKLSSAKNTLHEMQSLLAANNRTIYQMTAEEKTMYDAQVSIKDGAGRILVDCLGTLEKFCQSMPIDWIIGNATGTDNASSTSSHDFVPALLHLLREDEANIQVLAVACIQQLAHRKLDFEPWLRFISALPQAVSEANDSAAQRQSMKNEPSNQTKLLVEQLPFHRSLSKMLSTMLSSHLAHITTNEDIVKNRGPHYHALAAYLHLLAEMLPHPSGRICSEQINTWISLLRDPQVSRSQTKVLRPYMERVLTWYMFHMVRIRWDDVEEGNHPMSDLMEESWDDGDEYEGWLCDLRSKASQLFRFISSTEPGLAAGVVSEKIRHLLTAHGNGEPKNHLDPIGQLTTQSDAIMQLEGIYAPMDNILQGLPPWALDDSKVSDPSFMEPHRVETRNAVRLALGQVANMIVSWNPTDTWLRFRRATLLEALKWYWIYDPSTLPPGVDSLLSYLSAEDPPNSTNPSTLNSDSNKLSGEIVSLRKKSGVALISVSKRTPHLLVSWLPQLSERARSLLSSEKLLPQSHMYLYEFLSCVATAVEDPVARSNFIADVLSASMTILESPQVTEALSSLDGLLTFMGISQVSSNPNSATDYNNVKKITTNYCQMFSAFNQLLSVGKRCQEASRKRPNGGVPLLTDHDLMSLVEGTGNGVNNQNFPDEGSVSIKDLTVNDPFVPLWPRILPILIRCLDVILKVWHPENQAKLLENPIQRYALAISDDEAYLAKKQDSKTGGVFGKGGTAGSVVSGWDRRDNNLAPKWSGWFNELRNTCFQLLGLISTQRVLYSPEIASIYQQFVDVVVNPFHLRSMEHRQITQFLKQFVEMLLLSCPSTLYKTHLSPILGPLFEHIQYRLEISWAPILRTGSLSIDNLRPLSTSVCDAAAVVARKGGDEWIMSYYARGGLFVGDVDAVTAESAVEKVRVDLSRSFCDMLQSALALKGDWALVLANQAKEDQAFKKNDFTKLVSGPKTRILDSCGPVNADGTPRRKYQAALEARKNLRMQSLCHFLLLEDERVAGYLVLTIIECLQYPDAYTCRRCTRICHRILETAAWVDRYTQLLGNRMFSTIVKAVVTEPKWMVGVEWDMINLLRDVYCRLVLGQWLLPGGQGPGLQQMKDASASRFEQCKTVDKPFQGGGILCTPSDLPRQVLVALPGIDPDSVLQMEQNLSAKPAAKDQKDVLRDLLRIAAENLKASETGGDQNDVLGRATEDESLLSQNIRKIIVPDLPEKLVTHSMLLKKEESEEDTPAPLLDLFSLN